MARILNPHMVDILKRYWIWPKSEGDDTAMLEVQRCSFPSGPSNSPTCYEDSRLRSTNLKLKCEPRVLLPSVSAFYNPVSDSALCPVLTRCCETSVQLCTRCVCMSPILGQNLHVSSGKCCFSVTGKLTLG